MAAKKKSRTKSNAQAQRPGQGKDAPVRTPVTAVQLMTGFGVVAALSAITFGLPWLIPTSGLARYSLSGRVGYNNRVAMVGAVLFFAAGLAWAWLNSAKKNGWATRVRDFVRADSAGKGKSVPVWLVAAMAAGSAIFVAAVALAQRNYPTGDDIVYFVDRLLYLINGNVPYTQFEFSYGPLFLYPQLLVYRLGAPMGMSPYDAYYICLALNRMLGVAILAFVLNRLSMSKGLRIGMFLVVGLFALWQPSMGLNYGIVRFIMPLASVIVVWQVAEKKPGPWPTALAALGLVILNLAVSPEMGIALLLGILATSFIAAIMSEKRYWATFITLLTLVGGGVVVLLQHSTFLEFLSGSGHMPVMPTPPALLYILGLGVLGCGAGALVRDGKWKQSLLVMSWTVISLVLVVPSLGRADFGHIFWNGLGVLLAAPAVLAQVRLREAWIYTVSLGAVFLAVMFTYAQTFYMPYIWRADAGEPYKPPVAEIEKAIALPGHFAANDLLLGDEAIALAKAKKLLPLYGKVDVKSLEKRRDEVYILLRGSAYQSLFGGNQAPAPEPVASGAMDRVLLMMPVDLPFRNPGAPTTATDSIKKSWQPVAPVGSYVMLERK